MLAKTITEGGDLSGTTSKKSSLRCQSTGSRLYRRDKVSANINYIVQVNETWFNKSCVSVGVEKEITRKSECCGCKIPLHIDFTTVWNYGYINK